MIPRNSTPLDSHQTQSYLLRLWHSENGVWRAWVENVKTREQRLLPNIEALVLFLENETMPRRSDASAHAQPDD
jgi:hypothetical protein